MTDHDDRTRAGVVPFWTHQVAEMLVGVVLMIEGARTGQHTAVLFTMGGALLVLSLCSDGALGAWPVISRRVHRFADIVAAVVLALSPIALALEGVLAIVVLEAAAFGMLWLAIRTNFTPKRRVEKLNRSMPEPGDPPSPAPPPAPVRSSGAPLARRLGTAMGKARDDGPRQLGRMAGRARRRFGAANAQSPAPEPEGDEPPPERSP